MSQDRNLSTIELKIDLMAQMMLEGVAVGDAGRTIKRRFGNGMSWDIWWGMADGTYASKSGKGPQRFREKWAALIGEIPEASRPKKRSHNAHPLKPFCEKTFTQTNFAAYLEDDDTAESDADTTQKEPEPQQMPSVALHRRLLEAASGLVGIPVDRIAEIKLTQDSIYFADLGG